MSNSMERDKNERLTAREIEEEQMKRELTGIGIYEPGFTYKDMKRLLEFVNEFQDTSHTTNNKNIQEGTHSDNECLSDVTSDAKVQQEVALPKCTEMSRPLYSHKLNHTSPTTHERKTHCISPESPPLFETRNSTYRCSSDSDEIFKKQYDNANSTYSRNQLLSLRLENVSQDCQNVAEKKTVQDTQDEVVQKLARWRLNPLDICINENDVPLRQPNRFSAQEREPFGHCKEVHMSDARQRDQLIRSMSQHLKEMADLGYNWLPVTNSIFRWGSPIQVGTANSRMDKKSLSPKTEQIKAECTYRDSHERASKRKANVLIANVNKDSSTEDEESDLYDFTYVKKKRAQSDDKSNNVVLNQYARASRKKTTSNVTLNQEHSSDDNSDTDINNDHIKRLCSKRQIETEEDKRISPELTTSKRIITPNPKPRLSLARHRRENAMLKLSPKMRRINESKVVEKTNQKKGNKMTEEEIRQNLEQWSDEEKITVEKDIEIRPLPISEDVQSKLREKRLSLNKTKTTKEMRAAAREEDSDGEQNKKKKVKLCEGQKETELCRTKNRNGSWEHELMSNDEEELSMMNQESDVQIGNQSDVNVPVPTNDVSCPICNKWFPHDEIENHAADCDQFEINNEQDDSDMDQLECNICSNYKTNNGKEYDEHVQQCINNRNNQRHSRGLENTENISTSSFRKFKPISEQKDSEIDYLNQFPSTSKKNVYINRKRKR
ncbi:hypothetical protein P5V15_000122 [Pogonomyrmex californicus]